MTKNQAVADNARKMTLEQLGTTLPARLFLRLGASLVSAVSLLMPSFPARLAKKMRGLFSIRLNNILHEHFFVYAKRNLAAELSPDYISCNTLINVTVKLNIQDYTQGNFYFGGLPNFFLDLVAFSNKSTAFFDLGANMGLVSAALSKYIPACNVVAVEAMPAPYQRLKQVFSANCPGALAFNTALSSEKGALLFHIPSSDSGSASASLSGNDLVATRRPDIEITQQEVQCVPFDEFYRALPSADRITALEQHAFKIDVEGHEVELLLGMEAYLRCYEGTILIVVEVRPHTQRGVHDILIRHGFKCLSEEVGEISPPLRDCMYFRSARN